MPTWADLQPSPRVEPVIVREGRTVLGAGLGLGSPYGHVGAYLDHQFSRRLSAEMGGGYSGTFGPAVGAMLRTGVYPSGTSFLSLGLGFSVNFTDFDYATNCTFATASRRCTSPSTPRMASGSANATWLNVGVAHDIAWESGWGMRYGLGIGFLTNPGQFPRALDCPVDETGARPCGVGVAEAQGATYYTFYLHIDLYRTLFRP